MLINNYNILFGFMSAKTVTAEKVRIVETFNISCRTISRSGWLFLHLMSKRYLYWLLTFPTRAGIGPKTMMPPHRRADSIFNCSK